VTKILSVCALALLASCARKPLAKDSIDERIWSNVVPVTLKDGTRCVVAETNGGGGVAIDCDWSLSEEVE
jgi:hypothetical protein